MSPLGKARPYKTQFSPFVILSPIDIIAFVLQSCYHRGGKQMVKKRKTMPYLVAVRYGEDDLNCLQEIMRHNGYHHTGKAIRDAVRFYAIYLKVEEELKNGNGIK